MKAQIQQLSEGLEPCISLPCNVSKDEIEVKQTTGSDFSNHTEFVKKTIVEALLNSSRMRGNAATKIIEAV